MKQRYLILLARAVSLLFSPFYFPVIAFIFLFLFTFMALLPLGYKLYLIAIVYFFTVAFPIMGIYCYRKVNGWTRHQSGLRVRRFVPYLLSILSYGSCFYVLSRFHLPRFILSIIAVSLLLQVVCAFLNSWIKVSVHSAASAAVVGAIISYSLLFSFNPLWWLCLTILLSGTVASSRIILHVHTLREVSLGLLVGFLCGVLSIFYV